MPAELLRLIVDEIRERGAMPFARFMDLALHHPTLGYYASGPGRLGPGGDFITASDVGPAFGSCLARQIVELDTILGRPDPFRYVEAGAGRGLLAKDVVASVAERSTDLASRLALALIDRSDGMRTELSRLFPEARIAARAEDAGQGPGCVVAVELLDALPVHRMRRRGGRLFEIFVDIEDGGLVEVERTAGPELEVYAATYGAAREEGDEAEACLALGPTLAALSATIDRGFLVIVDYGHEASRMFSPSHRRGTLLAYHRHRAHEDYLARPGEQDLTAHVNLTALRQEAARLGWGACGITTQDRFLIANGILDGLDADEGTGLAAVKRRLQAKQLVHPGGMGGLFKVAIFAKGIDPPPAVRGVIDPFA